MKLTVDEERAKLEEIQTELDESRKALEPFLDEPDFEKGNDTLRKEIEKVQKHLRTTKQQKFRQNLDDWEKGEVFDFTIHRGRSRSRRNRNRSNNPSRTRPNSSSSENEEVSKPVDQVELQELESGPRESHYRDEEQR